MNNKVVYSKPAIILAVRNGTIAIIKKGEYDVLSKVMDSEFIKSIKLKNEIELELVEIQNDELNTIVNNASELHSRFKLLTNNVEGVGGTGAED